MLKRSFTFTNYDNEEVTKEYCFYLNKAELLKLNLREFGGLDMLLKRIIQEKNSERILELLQEIILMAVGEKSYDGNRFIKNDQIREEFSQTEAFSDLYCELALDADKAAQFMNAIIPQDMARAAAEKRLAEPDMTTNDNR